MATNLNNEITKYCNCISSTLLKFQTIANHYSYLFKLKTYSTSIDINKNNLNSKYKHIIANLYKFLLKIFAIGIFHLAALAGITICFCYFKNKKKKN